MNALIRNFMLCSALLSLQLLQAQTESMPAISSSGPTSKVVVSENDIATIALANNALAFDLFTQIADENLAFSPYSLTVALGMVYLGAEGTTQSQMARILRFPLQAQSLGHAFEALTKRLNHTSRRSGDSIFLDISNGLWVQRGHPILPAFQKSIVDDFHGNVKSVDFSMPNDTVRTEINSWIREQTQGKINELFGRGEIARDTQMLLASTIYMKARWARPFDASLTRQTPFFSAPEISLTVPMMTLTGKFPYYRGESFSLLELPYDMRQSVDLDVAMLILLPHETYGLAPLEKLLDAAHLRDWRRELKERKVVVSLPKFKIVTRLSFADILAKMGMAAPFSNSANFSEINGHEDLKLSGIIQKSYISVDEKGTEAAAATGATMSSKAFDTVPPEVFLADHPFVYLIVEKISGVILFVGRVSNPHAGNTR